MTASAQSKSPQDTPLIANPSAYDQGTNESFASSERAVAQASGASAHPNPQSGHERCMCEPATQPSIRASAV